MPCSLVSREREGEGEGEGLERERESGARSNAMMYVALCFVFRVASDATVTVGKMRHERERRSES